MKKMLIINERMGRFSGAEQNIFVTVPFLSEKFKIHFLYDENTGKGIDELNQYIEGSTQLDFNKEGREKYKETQKLLSAIQPDIIYAHKCMNVSMLKALRAHGAPLVRMQHDHDMYCMRSYKYNPLNREICTKKAGLQCVFPCMASLKRDRDKKLGFSWVSYFKQMQQLKINKTFDEVFVVTDYMKQELITQGFEEDKISIFPPVPRENKDIVESEFSDENIIIFATQIIRGKGLDCLIKALSKVKSKFKLLVFGEGAHKSACEELAKELNLEDKVIFKGFVSQEELKEAYKNASIGTVPSVWPEPIATVGLEFLRHGLPVVGFDAGGIKDWLKDGKTGYLLPWMDIDGMADKIDHLLQNKIIAKNLGHRGREFVNQKYNFSDYINRLTNHLAHLADRRLTKCSSPLLAQPQAANM